MDQRDISRGMGTTVGRTLQRMLDTCLGVGFLLGIGMFVLHQWILGSLFLIASFGIHGWLVRCITGRDHGHRN